MREWKVVLKHGLRNALIPVITILGAQLSAMIGGSVVVETVFAWPGIRNLNCFQCTAARFSCGSIWRSGDIGFRNICESFGRPFLWFAGSANTRSLKDFR